MLLYPSVRILSSSLWRCLRPSWKDPCLYSDVIHVFPAYNGNAATFTIHFAQAWKFYSIDVRMFAISRDQFECILFRLIASLAIVMFWKMALRSWNGHTQICLIKRKYYALHKTLSIKIAQVVLICKLSPLRRTTRYSEFNKHALRIDAAVLKTALRVSRFEIAFACHRCYCQFLFVQIGSLSTSCVRELILHQRFWAYRLQRCLVFNAR